LPRLEVPVRSPRRPRLLCACSLPALGAGRWSSMSTPRLRPRRGWGGSAGRAPSSPPTRSTTGTGVSWREGLPHQDPHRDNNGSPASPRAIRKAVAEKAVAVIDDGSTVTATADAARQAGLPLLVYFDGQRHRGRRRTPERLPARPLQPGARRSPGQLPGRQGLRLALVHDDSAYGVTELCSSVWRWARRAPAPSRDHRPRAWRTTGPGGPGHRRLGQRRRHLGRCPRGAGCSNRCGEHGSTLPVYTGPPAKDPSVRTTLAAGRLGAGPHVRIAAHHRRPRPRQLGQVPHRLRDALRRDKIGLGDAIRRPVVSPRTGSSLSYDMVYLLKAPWEKAGTGRPGHRQAPRRPHDGCRPRAPTASSGGLHPASGSSSRVTEPLCPRWQRRQSCRLKGCPDRAG